MGEEGEQMGEALVVWELDADAAEYGTIDARLCF